MVTQGMTARDFQEWMARMAFDKHGGTKAAAEALGVTPAMIRRYSSGMGPAGPVAYPKTLALACSALAMGLPPWGLKP